MKFYTLIFALLYSIPNHAFSAYIDDADQFRDVYYNHAKDLYSDEEIRKQVLFPENDITEKLNPESPFASFEEKEKALKSVLPSRLYRNSLADDFNDIKSSLSPDNKITIVLVPGVLGEFIDNSPFESVLAANSSLKKLVNELFKDKKEGVFLLSSLKRKKLPFNKVVRASSIDDETGRSLVDFIYLKPLFASLETVGNLDENNKIYTRRLGKLFNKIGAPKNLYIMGYSQGATVALEYINHLRENDVDWAHGLKGMISLGGVLYGSEIAQSAMTEGHEKQKLAKSLKKLLRLKESSSISDIKKNIEIWRQFMKETASSSDVSTSEKPEDPAEISNLWVAKTAMKAFHSLGLHNFIFGYTSSVKRFKKLIRESIHSLENLSYTGRINWWKQNTIPSDLKYFAITGVMEDSRYDNEELIESEKWGFYQGKDLPDYKLLLRQSFYDIKNFSGVELNDSQVSVHRAMFWPELHMKLNPNQRKYSSHYLGVLGTHHWGMAFPYAFESKDKRIHPFNRELLLKSIADFVSLKSREY